MCACACACACARCVCVCVCLHRFARARGAFLRARVVALFAHMYVCAAVDRQRQAAEETHALTHAAKADEREALRRQSAARKPLYPSTSISLPLRHQPHSNAHSTHLAEVPLSLYLYTPCAEFQEDRFDNNLSLSLSKIEIHTPGRVSRRSLPW